MIIQVVVCILFLLSITTIYLYYIGYVGSNKVINSVLSDKPIVFYFVDFLIITLVIIAMFVVF